MNTIPTTSNTIIQFKGLAVNCILNFSLGMQDALTNTYSTFACENKPGQVAAVGEGFRIFKNLYEDEFSTLYTGDGSHPSLKGSYLAACIHFSTLFGHPCLGNSYIAGLDMETANILQNVADEAVAQSNWNYGAENDCNLSMC